MVKYIFLFLVSFNCLAVDVITAKTANLKMNHAIFDVQQSKMYKESFKRINREIIKASELGDSTVLINMDRLVWGEMYDHIEEALIKKGYRVKWNEVGGIKGTSWTMYLQVAW